MSVLGWFLAVVGVCAVIFALRMMARMKKMQTVPFHEPSAIAAGTGGADAKGMISTEGGVRAGALVRAPMSGVECLAYQIVIERKWERTEQTENGSKTKSGTDSLHREYHGGQAQLVDAGGAVNLNLSKEPDVELTKTHSSTVKVGLTVPDSLMFGQLQMNTPPLPRDSRTVGFVGTEKVLKADGRLYALGALRGTTIGTPDGLLGKLLLSTKGREALLGTTARNMKIGYGVGAPLVVAGSLLGIFGPKPAPAPLPGPACVSFVGTTACAGRVAARSGTDVTWTVPAEGDYHVSVTPPKVKLPLDAVVTVADASGAQVAHAVGNFGRAEIDQHFAAGTYTVNVQDSMRRSMSGGLGFMLAVDAKPAAAPPATAPSAVTAENEAAAAGEPVTSSHKKHRKRTN